MFRFHVLNDRVQLQWDFTGYAYVWIEQFNSSEAFTSADPDAIYADIGESGLLDVDITDASLTWFEICAVEDAADALQTLRVQVRQHLLVDHFRRPMNPAETAPVQDDEQVNTVAA